MKKLSALITAAALLIIIWACSDLEHSNPFDPDWGSVTGLNNVELQIEKIDRIKVIWDSDYFNKDGYTFQIDRKLGDGEWQNKYKVFQKDIYFFTDSIAGINQTNTYRVRVGYDENLSEGIEAVVFNEFPAPTNFAMNRTDIRTVELSWSDNSNGEDGFKIDRYSNGTWNEDFISLESNSTSWTDTTAALNDSIQYRVFAYRKTSESDAVETERIENNIPTPSGLSIKQNDVSTFELYWTDNSNGEEGFIVQRSIDGSIFTSIDSLAANTTVYLDPSVGEGKSLNDVAYRVMSYFGQYTSGYAEIYSTIEFPAPSAVGYEKISVSSVRIFWTDNSISEDGFVIDKKIGAAEWVTHYASVGTDITSWIDAAAEINENLQYRVSAYKGINSTTTADSPIITNTFPAPTSLTYAKLFIYSIKLDWADNSIGEDGFVIDRAVNGTWTNGYVTLPANSVTYADGNVPINSNVQYRIHAYKGSDVSVQTTTPVINNNIPAPSNPILYQLAVNVVRIDWTDNCAGEDGYKIDRKDDTGTWTNAFAVLGANAQSWNDSTAIISDSLEYRIYAFKGAENSTSVTAFASDLTFPPPTNIQFVKMDLNTILLNWTDNSIGETGYKIDKQVDGGAWSVSIGSTGADTGTWTDTSAPINSEVQYRVYAYTATDQSSYGYSELIDNSIPSPVLSTVTQLSVGSFKLDWTDNSNGEDGFKIERKVDDGTYAQIASPAANVITYNDSSIDKKGYTSVYYRIKAYKSTYESAYSEKSQTIFFPAPTDLIYTKVAIDSIQLEWTDNSDGEDYFLIDRKVGALAWETSYGGTAGANETLWRDAHAIPNAAAQYKVYAVKGQNTSQSVLTDVIDNTFPAPTSLTYNKLSLTSIKLDWSDNSSGEMGFIIERKVGVNNWAPYDSTSTDTETWTDANSPVNETLQYRIKAYKDTYSSVNLESPAIDNDIPAPTNLTADISGMTITLNWTDNSTGEDGFKIDRMASDSVWVENFASVGSNIITWTETVADTGKYYYRVKAYNGTDLSAATTVAEAWIQQTAITFIKNYGTIDAETAFSGFQDEDEGYIFAMSNTSMGIWIYKVDKSGNYVWDKTYGGGTPSYSVIKTSDGNIVFLSKDDNDSDYNYRLQKIIPNTGNVAFSKIYGGTDGDSPFNVIQSSDGGYAMIGITLSYAQGGHNDAWLVKADSLGNYQWDETYEYADIGLSAYSLVETGDNGFIFVGYCDTQATGNRAWIVKVDSNGNEIWNKIYDDENSMSLRKIVCCDDGNYVAVGWCKPSDRVNVFLIKIDNAGNKIWHKTFDYSVSDFSYSVSVTSDGGFIITGFSSITHNSTLLIKTDSEGNEQWHKIFDTGLFNEGYTVSQTSDKGYMIVGYCQTETQAANAFLIKTDSNGNVEGLK